MHDNGAVTAVMVRCIEHFAVFDIPEEFCIDTLFLSFVSGALREFICALAPAGEGGWRQVFRSTNSRVVSAREAAAEEHCRSAVSKIWFPRSARNDALRSSIALTWASIPSPRGHPTHSRPGAGATGGGDPA